MVNDTHMTQFIPPTLFHFSTGTITYIAGQKAGTIVAHRAAADQTTLITVPVMILSNTSGLKGSLLKSIEIDYEILIAEPTSLTWTINKIKRGADGADATVTAITKTNTLAVATAKRVPQLPNVPTIAESGVPGFEATQWYGLLAPAGTPREIIDKVHAEIARALTRAEVKKRLETDGADPISMTPAEFAALIKSEIARWGRVIREAAITAE